MALESEEVGLSGSTNANIWIYGSLVVGVIVAVGSYILRGNAWWSDLLLSIGSAIVLVAPLTHLGRQYEKRTKRSLDNLKDDVEKLQVSVREGQESVSNELLRELTERRELLESSKADDSYEAAHSALSRMQSNRHMNPILGVRGRIPNTELFLRIVVEEYEMTAIIDTADSLGVVQRTWCPGERLSGVMKDISADLLASPLWPGDENFSYADAFEEICNLLIFADESRFAGRWHAPVFERTGGQWMLTDFSIEAIGHNYQITYERLDELDWFEHLSKKSWVELDQIAQALLDATTVRAFLRDTA